MNVSAAAPLTSPGLAALNELPAPEAEAALVRCCASVRWARAMAAMRPFGTMEALLDAAGDVWRALVAADWQQAFAAHPRIGQTIGSHGGAWAAEEQAGATAADDSVRKALAEANGEYERRFGYIFIVCASGLSGVAMLERLRARLGNEPEAELLVAAGEQERITRLRLEKLLAQLGAEP